MTELETLAEAVRIASAECLAAQYAECQAAAARTVARDDLDVARSTLRDARQALALFVEPSPPSYY